MTTIDSEYYDKLHTFYSEEDTKIIINKFIEYYNQFKKDLIELTYV